MAVLYLYSYRMAKPRKNNASRALSAWLSNHNVINKDAGIDWERERKDQAAFARLELKTMKPEAVLDLHGRTRAEAEAELSAFLRESHALGRVKVQIIHGKGNHSKGEPVIRKMVYEALHDCPFAGETGVPERSEGGNGAVWVILRQRSR